MKLITLLVATVAVLVGYPGAAAAQPEQPVAVTVFASKPEAAPGEKLAIAVVFEHEPTWHINTNNPALTPSMVKEKFTPIPTTIDFADPSIVKHWAIQWPKVHNVPVDLVGTGKPEPYGVFEGRAIAYVPIEVPATARPGTKLRIEFNIGYQACDDKNCLAPEDVTQGVDLAIVAAATAAKPGPDFAGFDAGVFNSAPVPAGGTSPPTGAPAATGAKAASSSAAPIFDLFGLRFSSSSVLVILLVAALGGFILNLTPCVLPVVPLKVIALQSSAGHQTSRRILLGTAMFFGVIAFWAGLGLLIVSLKVFRATNELFGNPYFLLGVGLFIGVMALGMMGAFVIQLPQKFYMLNPSHDSIHGSFGFGVVTAILGTPCFGPFAGAAAGWATTQPAYVGLATFTAIGVGMALPYLVLAIWPGLLGFVPRTGPASELVKQIMGLLLFAAGVFFIGNGLLSLVAEKPYLGTVLHWWGAAGFCLLAGVWLAYRTFRITSSPGKRLTFSVIGLAIAGAGIGWAEWQTRITKETYVPASANQNAGLWKTFSPEAFEASMAEGKVVVLDFTADWCINCKILEATVLHREEVEAALGKPEVVAFKVDLTSRKAVGWSKMAELNEVGIPLLVVFGPGLETAWKSNAYIPSQVVEILTAAQGRRTTAIPDPKLPSVDTRR